LLLVQELLEKEGLNWSSQFETICVQGTRTLENSELSNSLLRTAKKVSRQTISETFSSPGTTGLANKLYDSFARLEGVQEIVTTMASVEFDKDGEKIPSREANFEESSAYTKFCEDVYDRIDILSEHPECVSKNPLAALC